MPDIKQIASEAPTLATPSGLRLPTNALQMFRADAFNITPAVQCRYGNGFFNQNINAGAALAIVPAAAGNYFVINLIYFRSSLSDNATVNCGGAILFGMYTTINENVFISYMPNGLFSGTVSQAIYLVNQSAGPGVFSAWINGQYII